MICADFQAGASLDCEDPTTLVQSIHGSSNSCLANNAFLHELTAKAS